MARMREMSTGNLESLGLGKFFLILAIFNTKNILCSEPIKFALILLVSTFLWFVYRSACQRPFASASTCVLPHRFMGILCSLHKQLSSFPFQSKSSDFMHWLLPDDVIFWLALNHSVKFFFSINLCLCQFVFFIILCLPFCFSHSISRINNHKLRGVMKSWHFSLNTFHFFLFWFIESSMLF